MFLKKTLTFIWAVSMVFGLACTIGYCEARADVIEAATVLGHPTRYGTCPVDGADTYIWEARYPEAAETAGLGETAAPEVAFRPMLCQPYRIRLRAVNAGGPGAWSEFSDLHETPPDLNGDGGVGVADYLMWGNHFPAYGVDGFMCLTRRFGDTVVETAARITPVCP